MRRLRTIAAGAAVGMATVATTAAPSASATQLRPASTISTNTTLKQDLHCTNLTIAAGVTLRTNGHNIFCTGTFDNRGKIVTGYSVLGPYSHSYEGSGGGGADYKGSAAKAGYATRSPGGKACNSKGCTPGSGASPTAPSLTQSKLSNWVRSGVKGYLAGAGGGSNGSTIGASGANGVLIEAQKLEAGSILALGHNGSVTTSGVTGGGGGGVIVLEYTSYVKGTYQFNGGYAKTSTGRIAIGGSGRLTRVVVPLAAPTVTEQPANTSTPQNQTASFTSMATGNPTPTVQWQVLVGGHWVNVNDGVQADGSSFSGTKTDKFTITNAQPDESGADYWAVFTNSQSTTDSLGAVLTVTAPLTAPTVTEQPTGASTTVGQSASFTSTASGNPTPAVQWQVFKGSSWVNVSNGTQGDGSVFSGVTSTTFSITNAQSDENGADYWAVFSNSQGSTDSNGATLTVGAAVSAPTVTSEPSNYSTTVGGSASFSSTADGTPAPTVQWQYFNLGWVNLTDGTQADGSVFSGTTTTALSISNAQSDEDGADYRAVFTNSQGSTSSNYGTLTIGTATAPAIISPPTNTSTTVGGSASFTSTASGVPTPTVQWQVFTGSTWVNVSNGTQSDGSVFSGVTSTTFSITNVQSDENGAEYWAVFTNGSGSADSPGATLTVNSSAVPAVLLLHARRL